MNIVEKINTVLAIVIGVLFSLCISFFVVWILSIFWQNFPLSVQVFVWIITAIPSYLILLGLYYLTAKVHIMIGDKRVYQGSEDGFYIEERGRLKAYPSLRNATPLKQLTTHVTEEITDVPRLSVLLQDDMLINESGQVLLGYRPNNTPRYGNWPGVFAMLGIGNSGKSVSMVLFIVIAVFMGYEVVVCDPHKTKDRSIYKKLEALHEYITFAFTTQEIERETKLFSQELKQKKEQGIGLDRKKLLVFDELTSLVKRNPTINKLIVRVVEEASQEGMGYYHNVMLACHGITEDAIGDVAIRNALNGVFCHRIDTDQSKYVLKDKRYNKKTGNLPSGHVFYRDELHEIEYLVMPLGENSDVREASKVLRERGVSSQVGVISGSIEATPNYPQIPQNKQAINAKQLVYEGVNGLIEPLHTKEGSVYVSSNESVLVESEADVNSNVVNGSVTNIEEEKVHYIKRLRKRGVGHRDISYMLGLYGPKYGEYQSLCEAYSIPLTSEEDVTA